MPRLLIIYTSVGWNLFWCSCSCSS